MLGQKNQIAVKIFKFLKYLITCRIWWNKTA